MVVYKITNILNSKCYIGATTKSLAERKQAHLRKYRSGYRNFLYQAFEDFGLENFRWEIIDNANSIEELYRLEIFYISKYNSMDDGYNSTSGGTINPMECEKSIQKHKEAMQNDTLKLNMSITFKDKWKNDTEFINKTMEGIRKNALSESYREKQRILSTGRKHSCKDLDKMRNSNPNMKQVGMFKDTDCLKIFKSVGEASRWVVNNLEIKTKNPKSAKVSILNCCNGKSDCVYGHVWKYLTEKSVEAIENSIKDE